MRLLLLVCVVGMVSSTATGCSPVTADAAISEGAVRLAGAKENGAEKYARYQYFKAHAFLEEAQRQRGFGQYELAEGYAKNAQELAKTARQTATARRDLELRRVRGRELIDKLRQKRATPKPPTPPKPGVQPGTTQPAPAVEKAAPKRKAPKKPTKPRKRRQLLPPSLQGGGK